jgi:hypothetical protein
MIWRDILSYGMAGNDCFTGGNIGTVNQGDDFIE